MLGMILGKLIFGLSATFPLAHGLEGHFAFQGQQQLLSADVDSEFLVNLLTPKTRDVTFGAIHSLKIQFEGDHLIQYAATQHVQINNVVFDKATYYESKSFVKITVGDPETENYYTFIVGKNSISSVESVYEWNYKVHWLESTLQLEL